MELLDSCWRGLCALADAVKAAASPIDRCGLCFDGGSASAWVGVPVETGAWRVRIDLVGGAPPPEDEGCAQLALDGWARLRVVGAGRVPEALVSFVCLYGVVALAPVLARRLGRAVAISHFAQSLDGRIATDEGDSRWIGDMDNRVHAHRMRALCGAILVGAETLRRDRPRLNVRHVEGRDPVRVVLGATAEEAEVLVGLGEAPLWVVGEAPEGAELLMAAGQGEWVSPGGCWGASLREGSRACMWRVGERRRRAFSRRARWMWCSSTCLRSSSVGAGTASRSLG